MFESKPSVASTSDDLSLCLFPLELFPSEAAQATAWRVLQDQSETWSWSAAQEGTEAEFIALERKVQATCNALRVLVNEDALLRQNQARRMTLVVLEIAKRNTLTSLNDPATSAELLLPLATYLNTCR